MNMLLSWYRITRKPEAGRYWDFDRPEARRPLILSSTQLRVNRAAVEFRHTIGRCRLFEEEVFGQWGAAWICRSVAALQAGLWRRLISWRCRQQRAMSGRLESTQHSDFSWMTGIYVLITTLVIQENESVLPQFGASLQMLYSSLGSQQATHVFP